MGKFIGIYTQQDSYMAPWVPKDRTNCCCEPERDEVDPGKVTGGGRKPLLCEFRNQQEAKSIKKQSGNHKGYLKINSVQFLLLYL